MGSFSVILFIFITACCGTITYAADNGTVRNLIDTMKILY